MKKYNYIIASLVLLLGFASSCDALEPENEDIYDLEDIKSVSAFAEGILLNAYTRIAATHTTFNLSYAADDAVNNSPSSNIKTIADGGWTSAVNPLSAWSSAYESILYINTFIEDMSDKEWYFLNQETSEAYTDKLLGEAYALRAWHYFHLLQAHAGLGTNGQMLGVPIVDHVLSTDPSDYEIPRSSFNELVNFIIADCETAIDLLPGRWVDTSNPDFNDAAGARNTNRINGHVARLIKAKTLLYAASPAYSDGTFTYQMAAEAAAALMDDSNGLTGVATGDPKFYGNTDVVNNANSHPEVIWYSYQRNGRNNWENSNYAPSLYGGGLTNPSQNLVDAFPMEDGTPTPSSKINSSDPYSGRDPRLNMFILHNGSSFDRGGSTVTINTTEGSQDALGSSDPNATFSGYYLKKFMNVEDVDLDPNVNSGGLQYYTYARYTDVLLMFAEAANEVGGPDNNIGGYTAREVINAIRDRAGITSTAYVDGLNQSGMKTLIQNERRIELCFEKQRFWDVRRWNMTTKMKEPVFGVEVSADGNTYNYVEVESRNYEDYQIYGPIPFSETLKYPMVQNQGW